LERVPVLAEVLRKAQGARRVVEELLLARDVASLDVEEGEARLLRRGEQRLRIGVVRQEPDAAVVFLEERCERLRHGLFPDAPEVVVVVVGVVELAAGSPDDAPRAAVAHVRRLHRVLAIVAARLARQRALAIAEGGTVLRIGKRAAGADERERLARLARELRLGNLADQPRPRGRERGGRRGREERERDGECGRDPARDHGAAPADAAFAATFASKRSARITWRSWRPAPISSTPS